MAQHFFFDKPAVTKLHWTNQQLINYIRNMTDLRCKTFHNDIGL